MGFYATIQDPNEARKTEAAFMNQSQYNKTRSVTQKEADELQAPPSLYVRCEKGPNLDIYRNAHMRIPQYSALNENSCNTKSARVLQCFAQFFL